MQVVHSLDNECVFEIFSSIIIYLSIIELCYKMSDNEHPATDLQENMEGHVPKEPPPASHSDSSHDTQSDSSADVTPTRKTRKRPENKPPPEVQERPETASEAENASKVNRDLFCGKFL